MFNLNIFLREIVKFRGGLILCKEYNGPYRTKVEKKVRSYRDIEITINYKDVSISGVNKRLRNLFKLN